MRTSSKIYALFALFLLFQQLYAQPAEIVKLSEGVYAFITPGPGRDYVDGNSVVIITPDGAVVVDTRTDPKSAEDEIAEIKKLTGVPVKYIVNTHWHYDHIFGNKSFRDAYPDVTIIAHSNCLKEMNEFVPAAVGGEPGASIELLEGIKKEFETGKNSEGKTLTEYELRRRQQTIKDLESYLAHPMPVFSPPDITFDSAITLYLGELEIRVFNPGRAHTIGDAMVYIPEKKILVTGDVIVAPVPYAFGIFVPGMLSVINDILVMDVNTIVPGHGGVLYDKTYLHNMSSLLSLAYSKVSDCRRNGMTVDECQKVTDFEEYRNIFAKDEESDWSFTNYFSVPVIRSIYRRETPEQK